MSWVTDVVLLANLAESFTEDYQHLEVPAAITGINRWLERGNWAPLVSVSDQLTTEKAFQACAYGGALNRLDIPGFLKVVAEQPWREKLGVLLLLKSEEETAFTPYRLSSTGAVLKVM
jgi:hypothetical protein